MIAVRPIALAGFTLAALTTALLAGCGGGGSQDEATPTETAQNSPRKTLPTKQVR